MKKLFLSILATSLFSIFMLPAQAASIPEGAIIKTADNPDVYIVKYLSGKSYKRLILNPLVFKSYIHLKWENLITVDNATMAGFNNSELVRVDGQSQVFRLTPEGDTGSKVLLTSMVGLDMDAIYTINATDFNNYFDRGEVDSPLYSVYKVIDGDTITVTIDGINSTIRLIGIDTPEVTSGVTTAECYGLDASAAAKTKLTGTKVRLESDAASGDKDKYGRLLRYMYMADGTLFNQWQVEQGNAYEYTYDRIAYKYQAQFKSAEASARQNQKGLWKVCSSAVTAGTLPASVPTTAVGTYDCSGNIYNCGDFKNRSEAQSAYAYCESKVGTDIHKLDSDSDGIVCESLN
jgi:micrococcal nuclease